MNCPKCNSHRVFLFDDLHDNIFECKDCGYIMEKIKEEISILE